MVWPFLFSTCESLKINKEMKTYPETLLSVSREIPLRDSGGGDITGQGHEGQLGPVNERVEQKLDQRVCFGVLVLLSREEHVEVFLAGSITTAPGGTRTG